MKTMKSKFYSLALAAGMLSLTACSDDNTNDSNNDKGNGIENGSTLKGTITEDVTLKAGNTYKLSGEYIVEAGATLNIEEGVNIISVYDNIVDYSGEARCQNQCRRHARQTYRHDQRKRGTRSMGRHSYLRKSAYQCRRR